MSNGINHKSGTHYTEIKTNIYSKNPFEVN